MKHRWRPWWQRALPVAAALMLPMQPLQAVDNDGSAQVFAHVAKRHISGFAGIEKTIEVSGSGATRLVDPSGATRSTGQLSPDELNAFNRLLADRRILTATPECRPMGYDLPEIHFVLQYERTAVVIRLPMHCRVPPSLQKLGTMLDNVERKYLSGGGL